MAGLRLLFIALFVAAVAVGGKSVEAQVHHVVGSTDPSDIGIWSTGRVFKVGDHIWFNYSAEHEGMVELKNMEEYLSCDVSNPIKMYTDKVSLEEEGIRYFASGNLESCKNGLKLDVVVHPRPKDPHLQPNAPPPPPNAPLPPHPKAPPPPPNAPPPPPKTPPPSPKAPPPPPPNAPPPPPKTPPPPPNAPPPPPKTPPPPPKAPPPPPPNAPPPPPKTPPPKPKAPPPPPASSAPTYLSGLPYMFGGLLLCLMGL